MSTKKVFDLSKWNSIINYSILAKDCNGVILRVGYRGASSGKIELDPIFDKNAKAFKDLDVPIGIYFFSTAITVKEAEDEAKFCIDNINRLGLDIQFPIFIDTEYCNSNHNGRSDNLIKSARTSIVKGFIEYCRKNGYESAIYASESWFKSMLVYDDIKPYKKWVAKYSTNKPSLDNMIGWQYTSKGASSGAKGNLDISEYYATISTNYAKYNNSKKEKVKFTNGQTVKCNDTSLYSSSISSTVVSKKSGTYYIWSDIKKNNRIRITTDPKYIGDASKVTGWVNINDIVI